MNLFSTKKSLFLKIMNGILLLWLIAAIVFCYSSLVMWLIPEPTYSYEEYKVIHCPFKDTGLTDEEHEQYCEEQYNWYKADKKHNKYYNKRSLLIAFGNVVIVGTTQYLLNRKKED